MWSLKQGAVNSVMLTVFCAPFIACKWNALSQYKGQIALLRCSVLGQCVCECELELMCSHFIFRETSASALLFTPYTIVSQRVALLRYEISTLVGDLNM